MEPDDSQEGLGLRHGRIDKRLSAVHEEFVIVIVARVGPGLNLQPTTRSLLGTRTTRLRNFKSKAFRLFHSKTTTIRLFVSLGCRYNARNLTPQIVERAKYNQGL